LPTPIESTLLSAAKSAGIRHGYFTRDGGVSEGLYRGLNVGLGSHDNWEHVQENRRLEKGKRSFHRDLRGVVAPSQVRRIRISLPSNCF